MEDELQEIQEGEIEALKCECSAGRLRAEPSSVQPHFQLEPIRSRLTVAILERSYFHG